MPAALDVDAWPLVASMMQPATAAVVAASQRAPGRLPWPVIRHKTPVKTGAAPIVTTVPTATPVRAVAAK
jgi:hypothetical protein